MRLARWRAQARPAGPAPTIRTSASSCSRCTVISSRVYQRGGDNPGPACRRECGRGHSPTPAFCKKRLQAVENKGNERKKRAKRRQRGCKFLRTWDLPPRHRGREVLKGNSGEGTCTRGDGATGKLLGVHICWTTGFADWTNLLAVGHEVLSNALRLPGGT